jgi:hypothetical protein
VKLNLENTEARKRRLTFFQKSAAIGAILGAIVGAALTVGLAFLNSASDSHDYGPAILIGIVSIPSTPILSVLGLVGLKFIKMSDSTNAFAYLAIVNGISYCLVGFVIGWLIQQLKKNS